MDYLIKALALDNKVRVYMAKTTNLTNEAKKRHDLWPGALSVLSKTMTIGSMMGAMLKDNQTVSIKLHANGPIGNIYVDALANGHVRGYVEKPHINFINHKENTLNDQFALGNEGYIQVIKDLQLKNYFTSQVPLIYSDIAKDFAYYFNVSEQTPSAISLGILVSEDNYALSAGGFIVQLLPNTPEAIIDLLEERIKELPPMSKLLQEYDNLENILSYIFEEDYQILEKMDLDFKCQCSKDRFRAGIISLGKDEIHGIIEEQGDIETICHFCQEKYHFSKDELNSMLKEIK